MWGKLPIDKQTVSSHGATGDDQETLEEGSSETDCRPLGHAGRHGHLRPFGIQAATTHFHQDLPSPDHRL